MGSIEDYRNSNIDEVKVIQVVQVRSYFGEGTKESVGRQITEYFSLEGELLARVDDFARKPKPTNEQGE